MISCAGSFILFSGYVLEARILASISCDIDTSILCEISGWGGHF